VLSTNASQHEEALYAEQKVATPLFKSGLRARGHSGAVLLAAVQRAIRQKNANEKLLHRGFGCSVAAELCDPSIANLASLSDDHYRECFKLNGLEETTVVAKLIE